MPLPGRCRFPVWLRSRGRSGGVSSLAARVPRGPGWPGLLPLPPLSPWLRCALPVWLPGGLRWRGPVFPWLPSLPLRSGPGPLPLVCRMPWPLLLWLRLLLAGRPVLPLPLRLRLPVSRRGRPPWLRRSLPVSLPPPLWRPLRLSWLPVLPVSGCRLRPALPVCALLLGSWFSPLSALVLSCVYCTPVFGVCQASGPCFSWVCGLLVLVISPSERLADRGPGNCPSSKNENGLESNVQKRKKPGISWLFPLQDY